MDQVVFIPEDKTGILGTLIQALPGVKGKRKRQVEFNSLEKVLKGLKLLPGGSAAFSIAWGVNHLGEAGAIVVLSPSDRVALVPTPQENLKVNSEGPY